MQFLNNPTDLGFFGRVDTYAFQRRACAFQRPEGVRRDSRILLLLVLVLLCIVVLVLLMLLVVLLMLLLMLLVLLVHC